MPTSLVWFRRDLRTTDHAPLLMAAREGPVLGVWCLDPEACGATRTMGFERIGPFRARFLAEALEDLRARLRALGSELIVRRGRPEEALPSIAEEVGATTVRHHGLVGTEETAVERSVARALRERSIACEASWDLTLLDPADLPFAVEDTPEVFTRFRRSVEELEAWRPPLPAPGSVTAPSVVPMPGAIPDEATFGSEPPQVDDRAALPFPGGETAGLARLEHYLSGSHAIATYKETRNGMIGADFSSKFSPWLAAGCLSTRTVQASVEDYERDHVANASTGWMTFELLWRDYFQLILAKHGANVFRPEGLQGVPVPWQHDETTFEAWRTGRTGFPIVDANMRELLFTGFMSNRGRQIVASFLTKNLGLDWRWGAEWFESHLIDHDVASNYGNWNYAAGVGNDARGFRWFNLESQATKYDRDGAHARLWCPELEGLDRRAVHAPFKLPGDHLERAGIRLGRDYPNPIVDLYASAERNRRAWDQAVGDIAPARESASRYPGRPKKRPRRRRTEPLLATRHPHRDSRRRGVASKHPRTTSSSPHPESRKDD